MAARIGEVLCGGGGGGGRAARGVERLIDVQGSDQQIAKGGIHVNTAGDEWQG